MDIPTIITVKPKTVRFKSTKLLQPVVCGSIKNLNDYPVQYVAVVHFYRTISLLVNVPFTLKQHGFDFARNLCYIIIVQKGFYGKKHYVEN